jgi:hypothetical protein
VECRGASAPYLLADFAELNDRSRCPARQQNQSRATVNYRYHFAGLIAR